MKSDFNPAWTVREIAEALGVEKLQVFRRAARESWPFTEETGRGGRRRLYRLADLPGDVARKMSAHHGLPGVERTPAHLRGPEARRIRPAYTPSQLNARAARCTNAHRETAGAKLKILDAAVAAHDRDGIPLLRALRQAATSAPWNWTTLRDAYYGKGTAAGCIQYPRHLWPLVLLPAHRGRSAQAECDPQAWELFKKMYLRAEAPTAAHCYRQLQSVARTRGWTIPRSAAALVRRIETEFSPQGIVMARESAQAAGRRRPAQIRDRDSLRAMECVNADGHILDIFCRWPDGEISRPVIVAWQDVHSSKILSWRLSRTESAESYRLSFADLLSQHGIPLHVIVDNGRGIASKLLTGGAATRYRFKIKPEDPLGLLTQLVGEKNIHWTTPYSGQSKPIERAFRDFAADIAKDYRFKGAYTGNSPAAKPENYGSAAITAARVAEVVGQGILAHNDRSNRRGRGLEGHSFDDIFAQSAVAHAADIARPTAEQLSRWLLAAHGVTASAQTGAVQLLGNRYWSEELSAALAGRPAAERKVIVRCDPERLDHPVTVETPDGRLIGCAEPLGSVPVLSADQARETARDKARAKKLTKQQVALQLRMDEREVTAALDEAARIAEAADQPQPAAATVVAGAFGFEPPRPRPATATPGRTPAELDKFLLEMADRVLPRREAADA